MIRLITVDIENTQYNPHSLKAKKQAAGYHYQNTREIEYSSLPCHHDPAITTEFIPPREHFPLPNHLFRHFLCGTRVRIFRHPVRGYRDIGTLFHWQGSCIHFPRWTFVRNLVIAKSVLLQIQIQTNCKTVSWHTRLFRHDFRYTGNKNLVVDNKFICACVNYKKNKGNV